VVARDQQQAEGQRLIDALSRGGQKSPSQAGQGGPSSRATLTETGQDVTRLRGPPPSMRPSGSLAAGVP
jgi:hypothetical protein